jgi:hypothetical protein
VTPAETTAERDMSALLEELIREVSGITIAPDATFFEAGLTSATLVRVYQLLRDRLDRDIPVWLPFKYPNRRALSRYLVHRPAGSPAPAEPAVVRPRALTPALRRDLRATIRDIGR